MRRYLILIAALVILVPHHAALAQKRVDHIAAVIGNDVVTASDVNERLKLIISSSGLPNKPDVIDRVRPQVVSMLIEESIKNQEAERLKINITQTDIDQAIGTIAGQNKMTADQFKAMLKARGIPIGSLQDQIKAQMAWSRVVARKLKSQADVGDKDVDAELDQLKSRVGQVDYLLSEIVLPIDQAKDEQNARALANRLIGEIKARPMAFPAIAQQFSRAPGATTGGNMGWISADQLPTEIATALQSASDKGVIGPVKTASGLHILLLRDKRQRSIDNLPTADAVRQRLGMERLDRLQRRYYLDLRSSIFVENRD